MNTLIIPGPAQAVLADALELPQECSVSDMIREIERLKMAAAEGPQPAPRLISQTDEEDDFRSANGSMRSTISPFCVLSEQEPELA